MAFTFTIDTTLGDGLSQFTVPAGTVGAFNAVIDWGDGGATSTVTSNTDPALSHTYATGGVYTISITGVFPSIKFSGSADALKLTTVTDLGDMGWLSFGNGFRGCTNLTSFACGATGNTSNVTTMYTMFYNCSSLTALDTSSFNTTNVTNMAYMFFGCSSLTALDVSGFNTSNVTSMLYMFYNCSSLTALDVSGFVTSSVTSMVYMFLNCSSLTALDVSGFNTINVTTMYAMFYGCSSLTVLDVSSFNTSNVTTMYAMFYNCSSLTVLDVSGFNTTNVTNMAYMFSGCSSLTNLVLHNFDVSKVTDGTNFLANTNTPITSAEYDLILANWSAQPVQSGVTWHFGSAKYSTSKLEGTPLHPTQQFMGASVAKFVPAYATGQIIPTGGSRFDAGKWYTSATGGTTAGATLLTDTGVTDWVEQGLYQSPYGILVEGAGVNRCVHSEDLTNATVTKTGVTINANAFTAPDGATTMDGVVEDGVSTGYHVYWQPAVITAGSQVSASVYISKTGRRYWQVGCGSFLKSFGCVVDTLTGTVTATGTSGTGHTLHDAYVEDIGVAWRVVIYGTLSHPTPFVTVQATDVSTYIGVTPSVTPATNVTGIWGAQQEMGLPTSYMKSVATNGTRADSMGAIKWSTAAPAFGGNGFPHTLGNVLVAWQPQFNSGDLAAAVHRGIVGLGGILGTYMVSLWSSGSTALNVHDGTDQILKVIPAYNRNDVILLDVRFGLGADPAQPAAQRLQLGYANVTQGDTAFTIVASVPYDGAFTDTGFMQLLKALGGNNSVFGAVVVNDKPATDADLAGLL